MSERKLAYWESTDLVTPDVAEAVSGRAMTRLYGYSETMAVLVIAALRRERVSLQHIRQIVSRLRDLEFGVTEVKFAIAGKRVHFQRPDGMWEDTRLIGQVVMHQVLDLTPLRARFLDATVRSEEFAGKVERRRGALGSKPVIAGTRIPVRAVEDFLASGASDAEILAAYPQLQRSDIRHVRSLASA